MKFRHLIPLFFLSGVFPLLPAADQALPAATPRDSNFNNTGGYDSSRVLYYTGTVRASRKEGTVIWVLATLGNYLCDDRLRR